MKTCRVCREQIPRGIRFCPRCGTPWKSRAPGIAALLVLLLGGAAVIGHDLLKPADSWVLRYVIKPSATAAPADDLPAAPSEQPAEPGAPGPVTEGKAPEPVAKALPPTPSLPAEMPSLAGREPGPAPDVSSARPSPTPPGFTPPRTGTRVSVTLRTGAVMNGILRKITDHSIDLEKDTLALTLDRAQMAPESRARFFAADHADRLAKKEAADAAAALSSVPVGPSVRKPPPPPLSTTRLSGPRPAKRPPEQATLSVTNVAAPADDTRDAKDIFFDAFSK